MKVDKYLKTGSKSKTQVELDNSVFGDKINESLLAQALYIYLANQRQSNAHTKNRGEVSGGGKKPWRQKGTGRARHGSSRSPIWKGGGVTFGPTNKKNYSKKFSKKMKHAVMRSAFSKVANENNLYVFEDLAIEKTKDVNIVLSKAKITNKVLIIEGSLNNKLINATKNLKKVKVTYINELNSYDLLNAGSVILIENSLEIISDKWGKDKTNEPVKQEKSKVKKDEKATKVEKVKKIAKVKNTKK